MTSPSDAEARGALRELAAKVGAVRLPPPMNPLRIRRHPLWDFADGGDYGFKVWKFDCRICDREMEFGDWSTAVAWAQHHRMKHEEQTCPTCGNADYIQEDWT